jgi:hypothetical protein
VPEQPTGEQNAAPQERRDGKDVPAGAAPVAELPPLITRLRFAANPDCWEAADALVAMERERDGYKALATLNGHAAQSQSDYASKYEQRITELEAQLERQIVERIAK